MTGRPWWSIPALAAVVLAGCSSASPEDATACTLYEAANNDVAEAINAWIADGSPAGGSDQFRHASTTRADRVAEAAGRATGDLAVVMSEAARLARAADQSHDSEVAYFLHVADVEEACAAAGAAISVTAID